MTTARLATGLSALVLAACHPRHDPPPSATPSSASSVASVPSASPRCCGNIECRHFALPADAFRAILAEKPRLLGIGESHALRGTEGVEPATTRFTRDLLPLLRGQATDLVIELLLPNPRCKKETEAAAKEQKAATEHQAKTDQNDYVALGSAAKALGIRPHALEPTCDDLARIGGIGKGGPDAVAASLDVITRLVTELATRLLDDNERAGDARLVVLYGGALHNDIAPRPGREQWSFGPALSGLTGGRYVELDLVVPEFMSDTPAWQSLPWFPLFDRRAHSKETALLSPSPGAHVLVFGRSDPR